MKNNLPLIPQKNETICEDVVGVLREVFRDLRNVSVMPPPPAPPPGPQPQLATLRTGNEFQRMMAGSEDEVTNQIDYARKLSRPPQDNIFEIKDPILKAPCQVCDMDCTCSIPNESRLVERKDVLPTLQQDAGRGKTLWISNVMDMSPCNLGDYEVSGHGLPRPPDPSEQFEDFPKGLTNREHSAQSISIGTHRTVRQDRPLENQEKPKTPKKLDILCVPPRLDYTNFYAGRKYKQLIRMINTSNHEVRLSLRPPARQEFNLEICSPMGLTIAPGSDSNIVVRFKPIDNLCLYDAILIRISTGGSITVPIDCYHLSPLLQIHIPQTSWTSLLEIETRNTHENDSNTSLQTTEILDLGTKLFGEVHHSELVIHTLASHAEFFFITEDAWISCVLDEVSDTGTLKAGDGLWTLFPVWFHGGGSVRGSAWFIAPFAGFHSTILRIISSTTIARPLFMIADSLAFSLQHISIKAQEKDFDIRWEDDEQCQYYVNLGISFPYEALSANIVIENHSPIVYSFYWKSRPWNLCSCWREDLYQMECPDPECDSAEQSLNPQPSDCAAVAIMRQRSQHNYFEARMRVTPENGEVLPQSKTSVSIKIPNVGPELGIKQGVYMLILKDVPKASLPKSPDINIYSCRKRMVESIPGVEPWAIDVCDVVCCEMEVWWETVPIRFILDPPIVVLPQSRRLKEPITVKFHATQLYGVTGFPVVWTVPKGFDPMPTTILSPYQSIDITMTLPLIDTYDERTEEFTVRLSSENDAWYCDSKIIRWQDRLIPKLQTPQTWLGRILPNTSIKHQLQIINDTKQRIGWRASVLRWYGGRPVKKCCQKRRSCNLCQDRNCSCSLLSPLTGCLNDNESCNLHFEAFAPNKDGVVLSLVDMIRTTPDTAHVWRTADTEGRASLIAYRVQSPILYIRFKNAPGISEISDYPNYHMIDNSGEAGLLRPLRPLPRGKSTTYLMLITNTTPMTTKLCWQKQIEGERNLKVTFEPNDVEITPFGNIEVKVTIEGIRVSRRKVWYYPGVSENIYRPVYLILEIEISGFEVIVNFPLGDGPEHDGFAEVRRTEREIPYKPVIERIETCTHSGNCSMCKQVAKDTCEDDNPVILWMLDPQTLFTLEDKKKKAGKERKCRCVREEVYIPPVVRPRPPPKDEYDRSPIEIITSPRMTCVCKCFTCGGLRPILPENESLPCIQYRSLQVFKEVQRHLKIRNISPIKSKFTLHMRRFQMGPTKSIYRGGGVKYPGLAIWFNKIQGSIAPEGEVDIEMNIYADCFGLYYDQLLIKMDYVAPIILDVWVEAIGCPLVPISFHLNPVVPLAALPVLPKQEEIESMDKPSTLWISDNDDKRGIRLRNISRAPMLVKPFIVRNREPWTPILPFRLYLSFLDELPPFCPCVYETDKDLSVSSESIGDGKEEKIKFEKPYTRDEMKTRVILYIGPDLGKQDYRYYALVSEEPRIIEPGASEEFGIKKAERDSNIDELDESDELEKPENSLLLTMEPMELCGIGWYRFNMDPLKVNLRRALRAPLLQLDTEKIAVYVNAIELPFNDVMRIRKYTHIMNTGTGPMTINVKCEGPWWILENKLHSHPSMSCGNGCRCSKVTHRVNERPKKHTSIDLIMLPYSNYQMCLEIEMNTDDVWPKCHPMTQMIKTQTSDVTLQTIYPSPERKLYTHKLWFYKGELAIKSIPLELIIDYPRLVLDPQSLDLGFITDGDTKKTFFVVKHTSRTIALDISCEWIGSTDVKYHPRHLCIVPGGFGTVYVQYTARWTSAPLEGRFKIKVNSGASEWCQATLLVRATPTRDHKFKTAIHDHTDDKVILPPLNILDHVRTK